MMNLRKTSKIIALLIPICLLMPFFMALASQRVACNETEQHIPNEPNRVNIPNAATLPLWK